MLYADFLGENFVSIFEFFMYLCSVSPYLIDDITLLDVKYLFQVCNGYFVPESLYSMLFSDETGQ